MSIAKDQHTYDPHSYQSEIKLTQSLTHKNCRVILVISEGEPKEQDKEDYVHFVILGCTMVMED